MKCRLRESRLIAINEGERSLTAADVSAVYQINGDETKHSARNRMLANSHAGRGRACLPLEVSQTTQYKRVLGTNLDGRHGEAHAAKGLTAFGTSLTRNRYF